MAEHHVIRAMLMAETPFSTFPVVTASGGYPSRDDLLHLLRSGIVEPLDDEFGLTLCRRLIHAGLADWDLREGSGRWCRTCVARSDRQVTIFSSADAGVYGWESARACADHEPPAWFEGLGGRRG